jgi:hypothetical protein
VRATGHNLRAILYITVSAFPQPEGRNRLHHLPLRETSVPGYLRGTAQAQRILLQEQLSVPIRPTQLHINHRYLLHVQAAPITNR